jgi:hypothetical protein
MQPEKMNTDALVASLCFPFLSITFGRAPDQSTACGNWGLPSGSLNQEAGSEVRRL